MSDETFVKIAKKIERLRLQKIQLQAKEKRLKVRLHNMQVKKHRQNEAFFAMWLAATLTGLDYAWLKFFYPNISIRDVAILLKQPKSTLYDRVNSTYGSYDIWRNHLLPLAHQGSYHFIRIIYAYEFLRSDSKLSLYEFCQIYSLKYNTIREHIKRHEAENLFVYGDMFYLLFNFHEEAPFSICCTKPYITNTVLETFAKRFEIHH